MRVIRNGFNEIAYFLREVPKSTIRKLVFYNIMLCVLFMYVLPTPILMIPVLFSNAAMGLGLERKGAAARGDHFISMRTVLSFPVLVVELFLLEVLAGITLSFFILIMFSLNRVASIILLAATYTLVRNRLFAIHALRCELEGIFLCDLVTAAIITTALSLLDVRAHFQYMLIINLYILTAIFSLRMIQGVIRSTIAGRNKHMGRTILWIGMLLLYITIVIGTRHLSALGSFRKTPDGTRSELNYSTRAGINKDGFRGPDISLEKPANTIRIAIMGDSATYGFLVSEKLTFCRILETLLRQNSRGVNFQVINGGVPSYTVVQSLARLKEKTLKYDPDVVILITGPNDRKAVDKGLLTHQLQDFAEQMKNTEIKFVVCTYPSIWLAGKNMREIEKQTREFALSRNIPFIDLARFMRGKYFYGTPDRHPNARGHRVIADFLFRSLSTKGVIFQSSLLGSKHR